MAIGRRKVNFWDEAGEHLAIYFTVTNVTKIIIAADALVERGYVATLSRDDSYLEHPQRGRITLRRFAHGCSKKRPRARSTAFFSSRQTL